MVNGPWVDGPSAMEESLYWQNRVREETATRCTIWKCLESSEGFEGCFGQFRRNNGFRVDRRSSKRGEKKTLSIFQHASFR